MLSGFSIIVRLAWDLIQWGGLLFRPRESLEAEILFLRRQLALYRERGVKPRRVDTATRVMLTLLRGALTGDRRWWLNADSLASGRLSPVVALEVAIRVATIPKELRELIRRMARENPAWGQERIANELRLKLGLQVSPRTVGKYMPRPAPGRPRGDQRWSTFLRNHARAIIACDFCVVVTSTFRVLYVLVVIEHHSRRLIHFNVAAHPTAQWTRQQLREAVGCEERYAYLLHDRDTIFSAEVDASIRRLGAARIEEPAEKSKSECPLRTRSGDPSPRVFGLAHSALGRASASDAEIVVAHSALGPGVPDPPTNSTVPLSKTRHRLDDFHSVHAKAILAGLHREYSLARA